MEFRTLIFISLVSMAVAHEEAFFPEFSAHRTAPRAEIEYSPKGSQYFSPVLNMTVYESHRLPTMDLTRVVFAVYDIYGFHDHIKQIADTVAASKRGFRIVVPDFFRGGPVGSWENGVREDVGRLIAHYKNLGAKTFGMFGFCWGGRISVKSGQEYGDDVLGVGLVHPSGVLTSDADSLKAQALLLPASNDPNMDEFEAIVKANLGPDSVVHNRFTDMNHGFSGATGNWENPLINQRVDEVMNFLSEFFDRVLPADN